MKTAKEFIEEHDKEYGRAWSDSSDELAEIMENYARQTKDEILEIIDKGTGNRIYYKNWEKKILAICKGDIHGK